MVKWLIKTNQQFGLSIECAYQFWKYFNSLIDDLFCTHLKLSKCIFYMEQTPCPSFNFYNWVFTINKVKLNIFKANLIFLKP